VDGLRDRVERAVREVLREQGGGGGAAGGRAPLVAANWKMHMLAAEAEAFCARLDPRPSSGVEVVLCPPFTLVGTVARAVPAGSGVGVGAQDLHPEKKGAFTGEVSGPMLRDAGARYVIVGHSERRAMGEDDLLVRRKMLAALEAGLRPIACVGEKLGEREAGATFRVLAAQLSLLFSGPPSPLPDPGEIVVAYEPVWAIGTGRNATPEQAGEALSFIRGKIAELFSSGWAAGVRLLYGGSATPENAGAIAAQPDADGFLVGGAGLDPEKLSRMVEATGRMKRAV